MDLYKTDFAYKVLPAAKLAHDSEGNDTGAFIKISLNVTKEFATTKYNEAHTKLIPLVAEQVMIDGSLIQPISMEEYEAEHTE